MENSSEEAAWHAFLKLCLKADNPERLSQILELFLTHEEKHNVADRYLITEALLKGDQTQREMSDTLNVSIAKITRGSNMLKTTDQELKDFVKKYL